MSTSPANHHGAPHHDPDITRRHMAVDIRKFVLQARSLDELVAFGTLTPQAARFLEA